MAETLAMCLMLMGLERSGYGLLLRGRAAFRCFQCAPRAKAAMTSFATSCGRALAAGGRTARASGAAGFRHEAREARPTCALPCGEAASWLFKFRRQALTLMDCSTADQVMPNV